MSSQKQQQYIYIYIYMCKIKRSKRIEKRLIFGLAKLKFANE